MSDQQPQAPQQQERPAKDVTFSPSEIAEMTEAAATLQNAGLGQAVDVGRERSGQISSQDTPGQIFGRR